MQSFTNLKVWQRGHQLTLDIYRLSAKFPADERFGLTSQIRRAAASIPTNVAEGSKRAHSADYARFINIAEGSGAELSYLLMLARDLGFVETQRAEACLAELDELSRMLYALRKKIAS